MSSSHSRYGRHAGKRTNWISVWAQVLLVALGGATLFAMIYHGEQIASIARAQPEYRDTTLREWVAALKSPDTQTRRDAVDALDRIGSIDPEVVSGLRIATQDDDPVVRVSAEAALRRILAEAGRSPQVDAVLPSGSAVLPTQQLK